MTILMALGAALVVITSTETIVAGNFRSSRQAFYAAEAAAELAVAELRTRPNWIGLNVRRLSMALRAAPAHSQPMRRST